MKLCVVLRCMIVYGVLISLFGCSNRDKSDQNHRFQSLSPKRSNITFSNDLKFIQDFNIYTYRNFYNGGGVGVGDVNNDGWLDIYFTGNMVPNRLYLNNGDLSFTDVTDRAGVAGSKGWSTGVSMIDINGDGWLDIYVCNSGNVKGDSKQNELFINQKDGTFLEMAEKFGLADQGFSTHAAFFDYDRDGDMDVYMLNNSFQAIGSFNLRKNERPIRSVEGGDRLYRNDNGKFVDVSEAAGIFGSVIGFGLGVTVGDIDLDGWPDIYVSNDFFERDYIYMNNGDGTFTENLERQMQSISGASMGADMADINNDGYPDIFVTEMLPEPHERLKTKTTFENWDRYQYNLDNGYYHQFTRNMFQLNNGNGTFSEIGRMLGVEATDWSWGALIADFDNDGNRDLFVANGISKDLTDQDYINYISTDEMAKSVISKDGVDFQKLTDVIPSTKVPNYMFKNEGGLRFKNVTLDWGLERPSQSNGSVYADLDNDGDLDIVINNVNEIASLYINQTTQLEDNQYIQIELTGLSPNTQAIGTKIRVHSKEQVFYSEQMPVKGFQSSVDPRPHLGLGNIDGIDSLVIIWPDQQFSVLNQVTTNQMLSIDYQTIKRSSYTPSVTEQALFEDITSTSGLNFTHIENKFVDFDRDRLIAHMLSTEGPAMCTGDFDDDGWVDVYMGGAKDQAGELYFGTPTGFTKRGKNELFETDKVSEDVDCECFDADGDGDLDLYVASGGNEFPNSSSALIDRLYLNRGNGTFVKSGQLLPSFTFENSSVIRSSDVDGDGDMDMFVGVRAKPFLIGVPADSYLLLNDGKGNFKDATDQIAPALRKIGMVTDATWADIDADGDHDLIIVGEWMPIIVLINDKGTLVRQEIGTELDSTHGWWNTIVQHDLDDDGDIDLIVGNHGLNSRFRASKLQPVEMYVHDFDQNGKAEQVICCYFGGQSFPIALRHDLLMQLPGLKKIYPDYSSYKDEKIEDIFSPTILAGATKQVVYDLRTAVFINNGQGIFNKVDLPIEAQLSPTYAIEVADFDRDGKLDILLGGNFYGAKPEIGRYDASYGTFLKGQGNGKFSAVPNREIGLRLEGEARKFTIIDQRGHKRLLIARNNSHAQIYSY